jgi:threonine/homoserine/homoserine lactone efflux protein
MILSFFQGAALALSAAIMPGPFQAFLLSRALRIGWKRTLPAALAPLVTDGPIIVLVILVLTRMSPWALTNLQIAGGMFILYIAHGMLRSLGTAAPAAGPSDAAARRSFFQAVVMNALNPNPYLFWSVVGGPIILSGWRTSPAVGIGFLMGFFGTLVLSLSGLIFLFATAGRVNPGSNRILRILSAVALLGFGLYQIVGGIHSILIS